ncbi:hypothetical protein K493DRAFT_350926 [Basidiobolus meristosporus CBS 931.73]|uniref:rRNA-processing protein n=1 Tax=Basidiobolus meristosporus CBS 931.73 TaxID=1314790 RepID=A0A1Y1YE56_9FUNG|nr:hypothetical protein K493DRAFT_350926 [Basidiobolus meristosporus CBS 931.73]|eukprot:ORX96248.1 hypothetical protein K493DRAFT_350926 [Basidiobolus meristosporus CBS 931.73]
MSDTKVPTETIEKKPANAPATRVSGKTWKQPKTAYRRSHLPAGVRQDWAARTRERQRIQAVKAIEKELKDEKQRIKEEAKNRALERKKLQEEKERLEKLQALVSAKKLQRIRKKEMRQRNQHKK